MNVTEALGTDIAHVNGDLVRSPSGDLGLVSGLANLKLALFHRLMTVPGTLVHKPNYGVGLPLYENAPNSFTLQQELAALIEEQFLQEPRVQSVDSVSIEIPLNPQMLKIAVFVTPIGYTDGVQMTFTPFAGGV